jgi:hypothetical protein
MNIGDVVRVTREQYPDSAVEGKVTQVVVKDGHSIVQFTSLWGYTWIASTETFDIEVIRRVEPTELGSIFTDSNNNKWTLYSTKNTYNWINEDGDTVMWSELT